MNLSQLNNGTTAIIVGVEGESTTIKRLVEMGFVKGREIKAIKSAPLNDPVEYELMGYKVSLRRTEAEAVQVADISMGGGCGGYCLSGCCQRKVERPRRERVGSVINVAVVGNPNCGKTTLYNSMAGRHEHTGNYAGVTVDSKSSTLKHRGYTINITDLPGIYSLTNSVAEELVVARELREKNFDYIINVVDSTLLERNLFLTTLLMDMGQHIVVALNMYDELQSMGDKFDYQSLSKMLGIPFIPTIAIRGEGAIPLLDNIVDRFENDEGHLHIESNFGENIEGYLEKIVKKLHSSGGFDSVPKRYAALMLLDGSLEYIKEADPEVVRYVEGVRGELEREYRETINQVLANGRYGYISGALLETYKMGSGDRHPKTTQIDRILTHKFWGFPIFIAIMWFMFFCVFTVGQPFMDLMESGVGLLSEWVSSVMSDGLVKDVIVDGIISGVGAVIVFLPNILILFLFIALLEDSGYMARAAFIMDKIMHKFGLHGKSFIPMLMGFGCNVPAIMSTRIIEDRKNRLMTMLVLPFMSCSARLPVYIVLIGAFFPANQSLILLGIYVTGVLFAILSSILFRRTLFRAPDQPFVMELPPYRRPTSKSVVKHMWLKASQYLRKMATVILIGSVVVWALSTYPTKEESYMKSIGQTIQPVFEPIGFDWEMSASLVTGIMAKEMMNFTMMILYDIDGVTEDEEDGNALLQQKMQEVRGTSGEKVYTTATVVSLLLFMLLYFPCIAVVSAIRRESGSWRWALFSVVYTTGLAWLVSFIAYTIINH